MEDRTRNGHVAPGDRIQEGDEFFDAPDPLRKTYHIPFASAGDLVAQGEYSSETSAQASGSSSSSDFDVSTSGTTVSGIPPDSGAGSSPDSNQMGAAVASINDDAAEDYTGSTGECATYVGDAIRDAGIPLAHIGGKGYAADMGPSLSAVGFKAVPNDSTLQPGDVAVIQPYPGQDPPAGHAAMWNGSQWVSDYKQAGPTPLSPYPNNDYRQSKPPYTIYRRMTK